MPIRPILSSLRHHKLTALLLVLQVAFTGAVLINALPMLTERVARINATSGIDENRLSMISAVGVQQGLNVQAQQATDLEALRRVPGVQSAVVISGGLPFSGGVDAYGICPDDGTSAKDDPRCVQPDVYNGSPGFAEAMGLHVVEGRGFVSSDFTTGDVSSTIVTRSLAKRLYPHASALGKTVLQGEHAIRIVGIISDVMRPRLRGTQDDNLVQLWPQLPDSMTSTYLLRSAPSQRRAVLKAAAKVLVEVNPSRLFPESRQRTFDQLRQAYFQRDTTMIGLLLASGLGLLFVTALGIAGLASFWVQQRTRSIGIRRAIGARRGDILRYFQAENFLIVSAGVVLGTVLALVLNLLLMQYYELPRLPLFYLPIGALAMWLLGQLAVLSPALRAAAVPPVVATRSL